MLKYIFTTALFLVIEILPVYSAPDTVVMGTEVISVSDIRLRENKYVIEFQLWFKCKNDSLDLFNTIEVLNANSLNKSPVIKEKIGNIYWSTAKINADMYCSWDLMNFPFVSQDIKIFIKEAFYDTEKLVFTADSVYSGISKNLVLDRWNISSFKFIINNIESGSNFGNPSSGKLNFPTGVISLNLERQQPFLVIEKILLPVWVAFFLSLVVFWIKPTNVDPRFGLPGAGLFASVANKYLISEFTLGLPYQIYVETIHNHTFAMILVIIIISVISLHYCENDKPAVYKKIDKYSFYLILIVFLIDNLYLLLNSYLRS